MSFFNEVGKRLNSVVSSVQKSADTAKIQRQISQKMNEFFGNGEYTVTFDTDGCSEISPVSLKPGTAITAPADPTKTGYTFIGWAKVPATTSHSQVPTGGSVPEADVLDLNSNNVCCIGLQSYE